MNITSPRSKARIESGISFPILQSWNPVTRHATIAAQVNGKRVLCRIAAADLKEKYKTSGADPMQTVTEHREDVEKAARKLIEQGDYENDGSIMIRYRDL